MRKALSIARREVASQVFVLYGAIGLGIIPIVLSFLPYWGSISPGSLRSSVALGMGAIIGYGAAILLGTATFAKDLSERRMGFYFVRPASTGAIWAGKTLGALAVVYCAIAIAYLPGTLSGEPLGTDAQPIALLLLVPPLVLFFICNAVSISLKSKSKWLAVDLVLFVVFAGLLWLPISRIAARMDYLWEAKQTLWVFQGGVIFCFTALVVTSYLLMARGRTDLPSCHKTQSKVLWSCLISAAFVFEIYSRWLTSAQLKDLAVGWASGPDPTGRWVTVIGEIPAKGVGHAFLLDLETGKNIELTSSGIWETGVAFSANGKRAAWIESEGVFKKTNTLLVSVEICAPDPEKTRVIYPIAPKSRQLVLSPDGSRIAIAWEDQLSVMELPSGRLVAGAKLPPDRTFLTFDGLDKVRLIPISDKSRSSDVNTNAAILEFDLKLKTIQASGAISLPGRVANTIRLSPDGTRVLRLSTALGSDAASDTRQVSLLYAHRGEQIKVLEKGNEGVLGARFLANGQVLVPKRTVDGARTFTLFSPDGEEIRSFGAGDSREGWLHQGQEVSPGKILACMRNRLKSELQLIDTESGVVTSLHQEMLPAIFDTTWSGTVTCAPGSPAARLVQSADGRLILLDKEFKPERTFTAGGRKRE